VSDFCLGVALLPEDGALNSRSTTRRAAAVPLHPRFFESH
jgi:hypothetical protein